jgi:hypothetical protein
MIDELKHGGTSPYAEQGISLSYESENRYGDLEGEAENRLETYAARVLKELGDVLKASRLIFFIRDNDQERRVFRAKLSHCQDHWVLETDGAEIKHESRSARKGSKPCFVLRSQFHYYLDLPQRWLGT